MAKTVNQILKGAVFEILRNTKGAYSATISVEMLSNKPISSLSREVTVDLTSKGDEYKELGDERSGRLMEVEAE
jgi:hypothetical protein